MATCRSRCEAACMASAGARGGPGRGRALPRSLVGSGPLQRLPYVGCMWEREPKGGRHQPKTVAGTSGDPCTFRRLSVAVAARGRDRTLEVGGSTPLGSTCDRIFSTPSTQPRTPTVRVLFEFSTAFARNGTRCSGVAVCWLLRTAAWRRSSPEHRRGPVPGERHHGMRVRCRR